MKTKQVISRLTEIDKPQKSKNAKKNVNEIKKEKNTAFISKRLDTIFGHCRKVPLSVKRILKNER